MNEAFKNGIFRIDRGISQFNNDYYSVLGLPLTINPSYIRQSYLDIAWVLHPDVYGRPADEKEMATRYLARLVNPAYNALMKESDREAYSAIFKLLARRLMHRTRNVTIYSEAACELLVNPSQGAYERAVELIAKIQYQSLESILEHTAQLSELNLVYILYKDGYQHGAPNTPRVLTPMVDKAIQITPPIPTSKYSNVSQTITSYSPRSVVNSSIGTEGDETSIQQNPQVVNSAFVNARLNTAAAYMKQKQWMIALKELREILQLDYDNSRCLAMLGLVYININQPHMAKVSFRRALQINPQEALALQHICNINDTNSKNGILLHSKKEHLSTNPKINPLSQKNKGWLLKLFGWFS